MSIDERLVFLLQSAQALWSDVQNFTDGIERLIASRELTSKQIRSLEGRAKPSFQDD